MIYNRVFPGYDAKGSDLPPPKICAPTYYQRYTDVIPTPDLTLLLGSYAQRFNLGTMASLTDTVAGWCAHAPSVFPLPHPSWRNTGWIKKNPWFETELLPILRKRVKDVLHD